MATSDITPIVARLANRIASVANVGIVSTFDIYSHNDLQPLIVSSIGGTPTLRAWWITGPSMSARNMVQTPGGRIERSWLYQIHGICGVAENGDHIATIRTFALAVIDAIDADPMLNNTCHRTEPCRGTAEQVRPFR